MQLVGAPEIKSVLVYGLLYTMVSTLCACKDQAAETVKERVFLDVDKMVVVSGKSSIQNGMTKVLELREAFEKACQLSFFLQTNKTFSGGEQVQLSTNHSVTNIAELPENNIVIHCGRLGCEISLTKSRTQIQYFLVLQDYLKVLHKMKSQASFTVISEAMNDGKKFEKFQFFDVKENKLICHNASLRTINN